MTFLSVFRQIYSDVSNQLAWAPSSRINDLFIRGLTESKVTWWTSKIQIWQAQAHLCLTVKLLARQIRTPRNPLDLLPGQHGYCYTISLEMRRSASSAWFQEGFIRWVRGKGDTH